MKFVIHIGPDTIGVIAKSKKHIKAQINYILSKKPKRKQWYKYKKKEYLYSELLYAEILTYKEYFKHIRV